MPRDAENAIPIDDLIKAYRLGYFPMARSREEASVVWVLPEERGVMPLKSARAPRRLLQVVKSERFAVSINTDFAAVIAACAERTPTRPDTWINDSIIEAYTELHWRGLAHSVECRMEGRLVGGIYGIALGAAFCGESMFMRETDASKVAMVHLIARLKIGGFHFIDAQFFNDHLVQFGLEAWDNAAYQNALAGALNSSADFFAAPAQLSTARVLQSITQTS
ncbi:MAG: leucyl/phenylalanyl-tRNA--protein transferase [Pseudomonadota bacterium]